MPASPPRLCRCGRIHPAGARCDDPRAGSAWQRPDGRSYRGISTRAYRKRRQAILDETPLCRCGRVAVEVDHIWPVEYGGPIDEWWNLQALCKACHLRKTRRDRDGARRRVDSVIPYTVVTGPPLAGKSTLVAERMQPGDLVLDIDLLYRAVLPEVRRSQLKHRDAAHPFVIEARDAMLDRLARPSDVRHAWVITGAPRRVDRARFRGADVLVLPTPAETCLARIRPARRPPATAGWIRAWWSAYEPE